MRDGHTSAELTFDTEQMITQPAVKIDQNIDVHTHRMLRNRNDIHGNTTTLDRSADTVRPLVGGSSPN